MTQDQYSQARGPGYVVRDDVVPEDENEEVTDQFKPMTRFQKVASALRGDRADQDEADQDQPTSPDTLPTNPAARPGEVTRQAGPDSMQDHPATEPDVFGTTARVGNRATSASYAGGQPGAATIPDVPASGAPATDVPADEATGTAGRHAAAPVGKMRLGETTGALGDFSDLTYGNLIPDAEQFTAQWQQIQFRFVDDPQSSVTEAADIVAQVTAKMEAAIQERQRAIEERQRAIQEQQCSLRGRWGEGANADTEALRETLRTYKTFLDQLIGLGPAN